ncbi:2-halobenzoate 1%2C2-dioxygenase small subunit [Achromobacter sp. 2789STDY5608615]|uniref:aromatic-ring-hydroxylating dioxygenase subunit beta n=1 Tax=Achromobacter sp. 2789STDY5608615 TaxID=1806492 RepID=UPI0006C00013|nr:aromatic-ring-hydroxylating dioxygenase subunit beta [Achromobacter sp. 2789STDY5608615]CUK09920.1 2-halobenzoate 1%2C2-dioxygenase small subunit [Achromobacter sp. 2789STDY5608615]
MSFSDRDLIDFVYAEARLLDELRFEDWLELYADDGYYWMPLAHGQTDARLHASLMYEDKLLLRVRVERLAGQRTFSQQPKSRCHHLLQAPTVEHDHPDSAPDQGRHVVRTAFHYVETRQDAQTLYAGWATHYLVEQDGALRIRLKRVDLVNCDAAFGNIQLFM